MSIESATIPETKNLPPDESKPTPSAATADSAVDGSVKGISKHLEETKISDGKDGTDEDADSAAEDKKVKKDKKKKDPSKEKTDKEKEKKSAKSSTAALSGIQNLARSNDPFAADDEDFGLPSTKSNLDPSKTEYVHIRIQQRNGRKTLTTLQGMPDEYDLKRVLKHFKKEFACNGNVIEDEEHGHVIQLQGDQRQKIQETLVKSLEMPKSQIKLHGF